MKKSQIIGLLVIAVAIAIILTTFDGSSSYVTFAQAKEKALDDDLSDVHVVGELKKNQSGEIINMIYDPVKDPNFCSFLLVDEAGEEQQVVYAGNKPTDIEKTEKVVVIGHFEKETFLVKEVLLKCPSKYVEEEI